MLAKFIDHVFLAGYEFEKKQKLLAVIGRFSRGNTAVQDGQISDEDEMAALRKKGEKAFRNLGKWQKRLMSRVA